MVKYNRFSSLLDKFLIYTTKKEVFRHLVKTVDPRYEMLSAKYFSNTVILALFEKSGKENLLKLQVLSTFRYVVQLSNGIILKLFSDNDWILHSQCL